METLRRKTSSTDSGVRDALSNMVQRIFVGDVSELDKKLTKTPENKVLTNLPLQVTLFFNVLFYPFWLISTALMLSLKYYYLVLEIRVVLLALVIIFSLVEGVRLYLGYVGNLSEKIPEVAGFLLLTILPQIPFIGFLLFYRGLIVMPLEYAVHIILVVMMIVEVVMSTRTLNSMAHRQAAKYHLVQMIDIEHAVDDGETPDYPELKVGSYVRKTSPRHR